MNVTVSTTRRVISGNLPLPIITDRLIIRPYSTTDFAAYHVLLTDQGAMEGNNISPDKNYTEELLEATLPPYDSDIILGIFLKRSDGSEGDLIGDGGMYNLGTIEGEWPSLTYRLKEAYWGKKYATEFARAFMLFWWKLPCEPITLRVRPMSVNNQPNRPVVTELVYASVKMKNEASKSVLGKLGFELFDAEMGGDDALTHWRRIFSVE